MKSLLTKTMSLLPFILGIFMILNMTSCDNISDTISPEEGVTDNTITLSPYINEGLTTRMAGSSFEESDAIGVFAVAHLSDNQIIGDIQDSYAPNIKHIYNGTTWALPQGAHFPWAGGQTKVELYAYYPYNQAATTSNAKSYPFSIKLDQSTTESFMTSDFLWAKSEATSPTKDKIPLSFTHQMSKAIINIKSERDFTEEEVQKFSASLLNLHLDAIVDLSSGTVSTASGSQPKSLTPRKRNNPTTGYGITFEAIVLPQTIAASAELFAIRSAEGATPYIYKAANELIFSSQKQYTFNITISRTGISVTTDEIQDWITTPDIEGNINKPVKKAIDISNINWSLTRVYKVMDKGIQIAEVSKEYLLSGTAIDVQAIVVYPMDANSNADLTRGFVAQIMQTTLNGNNEYDPNTAITTHGGSVSWHKPTNLMAYTAGKSDIINKVQIDKSDISAAGADAIYSLTLEPDMVADIDENKYGVVKIGTQYWMRENLKVERYRDGSQAETYYYNNSIANKNLLGGLYTWNTVNNTSNLAPKGWHIPTHDEFKALSIYAAGTATAPYYNAGKKLKAMRMWSTTVNNSNITGFDALPGGRRLENGAFNEINLYGQWWSTTEYNAAYGKRVYIDYGNPGVWVEANILKTYAESVRCLRN